MKAIYLNWRGPDGLETVDSLNATDFPDRRAMRKEAARLVREYSIAGMAVYQSSRACRDWGS